MSNSTKAIMIAVDVIIVCLLISLCYRNYQLSAQLANTDAQKLNEAQEAYLTSDITSLEGVSLKGTTVINAVKKYKDDMTVRVITESGQREFSEETPFLNVIASGEIGMDGHVSTTGATIIDPDGIFYCTHESNLNGVTTCLVFTQKGVTVNNTGEDYWTAANIRQTLLRVLNGFSGIDSSTNTSALLSTIEDNLTYEDKCKLAAAVGGSPNQKYGALVDSADSAISSLNDKVTKLKKDIGAMYACSEGTLSNNSNGNLADAPVYASCPVMAYVQDTITRCTYYYYQDADSGGFWVSNDDPNFEGSNFNKLAFAQTPDGSGYYLCNRLSAVKYTLFFKPDASGD